MTVSKLAKILGYAGLVPFVCLSLAAWIAMPVIDDPHYMLIAYAAVILSFMGAVHWGIAMSKDSSIMNAELGLSVLPALLGWLALLMPALIAYILLITGFGLLFAADRVARNAGVFPDWYLPMRFVLTLVVIVCMVFAALALLATS